MAYASNDSTRAAHGLSARVANLMDDFRGYMARRKVFKQTFAELASLSDRELNDLGLNRSMIRRISWQAAQGN